MEDWSWIRELGLGGAIGFCLKWVLEERSEHEKLDRAKKCLELMEKGKALGVNVSEVMREAGITVTPSNNLRQRLREEIEGRKCIIFLLLLQQMRMANILTAAARQYDDMEEYAMLARREFAEHWENLDEDWAKEIVEASAFSQGGLGDAMYRYFQATHEFCCSPSDENWRACEKASMYLNRQAE